MCPSWSGYMSSTFNGQVSPKFRLSMLPIIDLSATDPTALYSLLLFLKEQCKKLNIKVPCITFDQQLYIKAYEIVQWKRLGIFVRLGGFHQLMSFLGSIGNLMDGSGLKQALETVYAPVTVRHMVTGKAYPRSVRWHILCASAVQSILIEELWSNLSPSDKEKLEIYTTQMIHVYLRVKSSLYDWKIWWKKNIRISQSLQEHQPCGAAMSDMWALFRISSGLKERMTGICSPVDKRNAQPFCSNWPQWLRKVDPLVSSILSRVRKKVIQKSTTNPWRVTTQLEEHWRAGQESGQIYPSS